MKNLLKKIGLLPFVLLVLSACNKDSLTTEGKVDVVFEGSNQAAKSLNNEMATVVYKDFVIYVREIKFDVDDDYYEEHKDDEGEGDDDEDKKLDTVYSDTRLKGPFVIQLLENGVTKSFSINNLAVPNAKYDKIKFKLDGNEQLPETDPMYKKSVKLTGTIDGTPFILWDKEDKEIKIEYPENTDVVVDANSLEVVINMNLANLTSALENINLGDAKDGDGDGTIEIGPDNEDNNKEIAEKLFKNIERLGKLKHQEEKDDDDDEKDSEEEDND